MKKRLPIILLNFSGVYDYESFASEKGIVHVDMSLLQLQAVLRIIYANEKVIGVDITGECYATLDYLSEVKDASVNNRANEELMQMILSES